MEGVWARPCKAVEDKGRNIFGEIYKWTTGDGWSNNETPVSPPSGVA